MAESGVSDTPAPLDRPPVEQNGGMEASPALIRARSRQKPAISATQQDGLDGNPKAKQTKEAADQKAMAAPAAITMRLLPSRRVLHPCGLPVHVHVFENNLIKHSLP